MRLSLLRRYPVKSMLGEAIVEGEVTLRGLEGDRRYALIDEATGKVASAKRPSLWRKLLTCSAETLPEAVIRITLPDGRRFLGTEPALDEALSQLLGRQVSLASVPPPGAQLERAEPEAVVLHGSAVDVPFAVGRLGAAAPEGTFFDFAPLHLVTTATLAALSSRGQAEVVRFRPNIVIDLPAAEPFLENGWSGRLLQVGEEVQLKVLLPTPRCAVPTLAHGELPGDPALLRLVTEQNRVEIPAYGVFPCVGAYAQVVRPGRIRQGDAVRLL